MSQVLVLQWVSALRASDTDSLLLLPDGRKELAHLLEHLANPEGVAQPISSYWDEVYVEGRRNWRKEQAYLLGERGPKVPY